MLVLMQPMVMPEIPIVENYSTMNGLGLRDTVLAIGLPCFPSAFGIFLMRHSWIIQWSRGVASTCRAWSMGGRHLCTGQPDPHSAGL